MDLFDTHCFIEFFYRLEKGFLNEHNSKFSLRQLNEKYGVFDGCENLARRICEYIVKWNKTVTVNSPKIVKFKISDSNWVGVVELLLYNDTNSNIAAAYVPNKSNIIDKVFNTLYLQINLKNFSKEKILVSLMHELTHAYEDYNRIVKGKETLSDVVLKTGYNRNLVGMYMGYKNCLSYIFYYIHGFERNAFITDLYAELKNCHERFVKIDDIIDFLKHTDFYGNYMVICDWIDDIAKIDNKDEQDAILKFCENDISNMKFRSYKHFVKYLLKKKYSILKKYNTLIPKIAYDYLDFGNLLNNFDGNLTNG